MNDCNVSIDGFLNASFKGVPFPIKTIVDSAGRRNALGEFPLSENIDYVDLGKKAERFSFTGTFSGKYHKENAMAFYNACKSQGAGILVHPNKGILSVGCTDIKINNDLYEGLNTTDYSVEFVEASIDLSLDNIFKYIENISINGFMKEFIDSFKLTYQYQNVLWVEQDEISNVFSNIKDIFQQSYISESIIDSTLKWQIVQNIKEVKPNEIIKRPEQIATIIYNIIAFLFRDCSQQIEHKIFLCKNLINNVSIVANLKNSNLIIGYTRVILLGQLLLLYKNTAQVIDVDLSDTISSINSVFNDELNILQVFSCYDLYNILFSFRVKTLKFFYSILYSAKNRLIYNFYYSVPPLVASWEIYGDATKSNEIRQLNEVNNLTIENKVTAIV